MRNNYLSRAVVFVAFSLLSVLSVTNCFAQLSQVVSEGSIYSPPSPEASALLRYANTPVDEHTGVPSVVLPIDKLQGRQLSVPITLSYHAAGNKVQDIASNVGLGFVLNTGGVITRVMRGLPDEAAAGYQYTGKRVYSNTIDSAYLNATMNNKIDAEPDMFYFNFLGHTGKMVVDTNGNAQYLPDQGIRVISHPIHNNTDSTNNAWVLKDLNGTTYVFGTDTSSREVSVVYFAGKITQAITYTSSWYLAKVITPDGKETINFKYNSGPTLSYQQYRNVTTYIIQDNNTDKRKGIFSSKVIHTDSYSAIDVKKNDVSTVIQVLNPKYLSSIQNDMGFISFSYGSRLDLSGGQALNQIKVYNINDSATPLKTYTFNESYFISPHSSTVPDSCRLRLDCVTLQGRSAEIKQLFVFSYNEQVMLPPRTSDSFDHWGYYNTLDNRAGYPPVNLTEDGYANYVDGFDRRAPDSTKIQAWILTRVRNVNGGYTNFTYAMDDYKYNGGSFKGGGLRIKTIVENDSLGQVVPLVKQYIYKLDDGTSSGMIYNAKPYYIQGILGYQAGTVVQPIPSLLSYEIANLKKPLTIAATAVEVAVVIIGGTSPVGLIIDVGVLIIAPAAADAYQFLFHRTHKYTTYSPPFSISSTPLDNLFDINGASVTYSEVAVLNADGGRTVDYYTSQQEYPDSTSSLELNVKAQAVKGIYGNAGSFPPATSYDFERGLLKQSKLYDNYNNLVSMTTNTYQLSKRLAAVSGLVPSISGYASLLNGGFQVITYNAGFYNCVAQNIQLLKSVTQLYDQVNNGNSISSIHTYTWQSAYPTLLHSESTPRSDGKLLVNYISYPMEYAPGTTFLDNMVSHYMLAVPIERISTLQDSTGAISITGGVINRYKPGGLGLLDTTFSIAASNPIAINSFKLSNQVKGIMNGVYGAYSIDKSYIPKAFYQIYDSKNNLIQSENVGDPPSSIIWGYNQDVPIAQISNATIGTVAYTSFETNDQQYWQFANTGRDSSALAKTGKVRYQLSRGAVTTTVALLAGSYIVSLWTQGTKPTIGGITADVSIVNGESDGNSWNFYMDRVTVAAGTKVTLSGSGLIDELRLYPQGAHMSTVSITPQVGTSSVASMDDKVNTYEYDALLRSATLRDDQYNILKQFSYSNVAPVPCVNIPDTWIGINPVCYTDQTNVIPNAANYSAIAVNSYGTIICNFTRTAVESSYLAKINYTVKFTDSTTYTSSILLQSGDLSTLMGLPLTGKSAESVFNIGLDTVINLSNSYGETYQSFQNRQRVRDGYTEANTLSGGLGTYIAPVQDATGCPLLFTNTAQTGFTKNDCTIGTGSFVDYTIPAGLYNGSSQFQADSLARVVGQAYANVNGNCTSVDTSFVGINLYCITDSTHHGTPTLSAYSIALNSIPQISLLNATITRSTAEAAYDAIVTYKLSFIDGSVASYTSLMYMNQSSINFSPPLGGYSINSVQSITITGVIYIGLPRQAFANRQRLLNGVADGYTEANTPGEYYLAPLESPGACQTWFYSAAQTGFYRNNCSGGGIGSFVSYTVPARADSSLVSQAYADEMARIQGQAYANSIGSCTLEPYVTTYAGTGQSGDVDGTAATAKFEGINNLAIDNSGNLYVDETFEIRKITPSGIVSTFVPSSAGLSGIFGIATDAAGNVYACDQNNAKVRKITPAGVISTLAGSSVGYADGQGSAAKFSTLRAIAVDPAGNVYVGDYNRIRKITPGGLVSTFAGDGNSSYKDGPVATAEFNDILAITVDNSGNVYVFEYYNGRIRKISNGVVTTVAITLGAPLYGVVATRALGGTYQMTTDAAGNLFIADFSNGCVSKLTTQGIYTTITQDRIDYGAGDINGPLSSAWFNQPTGIAIDAAGNLYLGEASGANLIRKITFPQ